MPAVEAKELVGEGNSPAQVTPFQWQLKSPHLRKNKPNIHLRQITHALESPHVDCSDSPETSEPPHSELEQMDNKSTGNEIHKPWTSSGRGPDINAPGSLEHEHRETKDQDEHENMHTNHKSRARLNSDERLLRFDSMSDTNCEFRQEVSKLTSQKNDPSKHESEHQDEIPQLGQSSDKGSHVEAPKSAYDNCPLSATSNPLHIGILKEKNGRNLVESMPRILPPQDVQSGDLDKTYENILPFSSKHSDDLQQPLLEENIQTSLACLDDKLSLKEESNKTIQNIHENPEDSARDWLCCW